MILITLYIRVYIILMKQSINSVYQKQAFDVLSCFFMSMSVENALIKTCVAGRQ